MNGSNRKLPFAQLKKDNPSPTTELEHNSNFELLIAVILSAQATDTSVNKATFKLYEVAKTPQEILNLGEKRLREYIKTIGLFNTKAKNFMKTCQLLVDHHDAEVPNSRDALESLPGVGRKTANVVLNTVFNQETIAVDTHIFRVSNRTGLAPEQKRVWGRTETVEASPCRIPVKCSPLVNSSRSLYLYCPQTKVLFLQGREILQVQTQNLHVE